MAKPVKIAARNKTATAKKATVKPPRKIDLSLLCAELEKAAAGLLQPSESDCGYQFFALMQRNLYTAGDPLTANELLAAIGISEELLEKMAVTTDQLVEERDFKHFFPSTASIAESMGESIHAAVVTKLSKKYRSLEKLLVKRLKAVKVFRVGTVDVRCYIAGFVNGGNIAGLVTTVIET